MQRRYTKREALFLDMPDVMNVDQLQEVMGIGRSLAYKLINDGIIPHFKLGRKIKIPKSALRNFVMSCDICYNDSGNSLVYPAVGKEIL